MPEWLIPLPDCFLRSFICRRVLEKFKCFDALEKQSEIFHLYLDLHTPESKIEALRERLDDFTREHSHDVKDVIASEDTIDGKEAAIKMWVSLRLQHNLQNNEYRYKFRSQLWLAIKIAMNELAIGYMPPENRVRVTQGHYPTHPCTRRPCLYHSSVQVINVVQTRVSHG